MIYAIIFGSILVVVLILIFVIMIINYKNKYDFLYIKIKEADNNLDILLQKKEEILLKIVPGFKHLQNIKTVETIEKWLFFCQIFVFYLAYNTRTML